MRAQLDARSGGRFLPTYYEWRDLGLTERVARRFGRRPTPRLVIEPGADVASVSALWLAGGAAPDAAEFAALLDRLPKLAWIYSQRTGVDHLPLDLLRARGVAVSNTAGLTSAWVAEMNLACVLAHAKRLPDLERLQRRHAPRALIVRPLGGLTVLILGTGAIGTHTAELCAGVGMRTIGASRRPERLAGAAHPFGAVVSLEEALQSAIATADALVLALPLAPETAGLISGAVLARMRPGAALVNLARPRIVDEPALVRGLRAGTPAAAWVSRLETSGILARRRAAALPGLHLTHTAEANVPGRLDRALAQFLALEQREREGVVENRVV